MLLFNMLILAAYTYKVRAKGIINFNTAWIKWVFGRSDFVADATSGNIRWFTCAFALTVFTFSIIATILSRALAPVLLGCALSRSVLTFLRYTLLGSGLVNTLPTPIWVFIFNH